MDFFTCHFFTTAFFRRHHLTIVSVFISHEKHVTLDTLVYKNVLCFGVIFCTILILWLWLVASIPLCIVIESHFLMGINENKDRTKCARHKKAEDEREKTLLAQRICNAAKDPANTIFSSCCCYRRFGMNGTREMTFWIIWIKSLHFYKLHHKTPITTMHCCSVYLFFLSVLHALMHLSPVAQHSFPPAHLHSLQEAYTTHRPEHEPYFSSLICWC